MGHDDVAALLAARGWTSMPAEDIFVGPGGRRCYWRHSGSGVPRRPAAAEHGLLPQAPVPDGNAARPARLHAQQLISQKKSKVRARQRARQREFEFVRASGTAPHEKAHPMGYLRKQPGCSAGRPNRKPALNMGGRSSWRSGGAWPIIWEEDAYSSAAAVVLAYEYARDEYESDTDEEVAAGEGCCNAGRAGEWCEV